MKKILVLLSMIMTAALLLCGCVKDLVPGPFGRTGGEVDCTISFGSPTGPQVSVSTKGDMGTMRESNVFNLYLLIFDGDQESSKKIYGHYFTGDVLRSEASGGDGLSNWWSVNNMSSDTDETVTNGVLHFKTTAHDECTLVAIANLNPNDLDVSAGLLSTIRTYGDLIGSNALIASQIRSEVTANSGYFMMTATETGVNIGGSNDNMASKNLLLKRLYAKVSFNVRIAPNAPIRSFVADKWQVVNVPTCCYLLPKATDAATAEDQFFNTEPEGFEPEELTDNPTTDLFADGKPVTINSFSFYMMENRKDPTLESGLSWSDADSYTYREKQVSGTGSDRAFKYAHQFSTYVILTGKIVMDNINSTTSTLDANVKYKVHLGDFSPTGSNGDFRILRNHNYVYNIYINGAEDIRIEVEGKPAESISPYEKEPGATGRVVVADETIFTSDCHYSTQVISFHANKLNDPTKITWYVETPFNPEGRGPADVNNDLTQLDYKWVEFMLNDKIGGVYTNRRVIYKPHPSKGLYDWSGVPEDRRTKYVNQVVDYLIEQKALYDDPSTRAESAFDNTPDADGGPKISFTAFVDEFYYTENPLGGGGTWYPNLWKDYIVNQPMRRMHILASFVKSADQESSSIGSSLTIQQRSIQTIYAVHEASDLHSAWGMEFHDDYNSETGEATFWKDKNPDSDVPDGDLGNTSSTNGRLNTMRLWRLLEPDGLTFDDSHYWSEFLNLSSPNETAQLWSKNDTDPANTGSPKWDYRYLRYSCLSRNRDNNGNERIDQDEIRWYMASDLQLIGVFLGSYGIEGDARLYQVSASGQQASGDNWRQHVVASNRYLPATNKNSNQYARVIWAEEGMNGSGLQYTSTGQTKTFSTRCIRNLGYYNDGGQRKDITTAPPDVEPDYYIKMQRMRHESTGDVAYDSGSWDNDVYYDFDCSRINLASLRDPLDHELVGHDENSRMACLSRGFETASVTQSVSVEGKSAYVFNGKTYNLTTFEGMNKYLDAAFGEFDTGFSVCPEGYRLPNVREMAVMWNMITTLSTGDGSYLPNSNDDTIPSRTFWTKGKNGSVIKDASSWGWGMIRNKLLMSTSSHKIKKPRCVRDL